MARAHRALLRKQKFWSTLRINLLPLRSKYVGKKSRGEVKNGIREHRGDRTVIIVIRVREGGRGKEAKGYFEMKLKLRSSCQRNHPSKFGSG